MAILILFLCWKLKTTLDSTAVTIYVEDGDTQSVWTMTDAGFATGDTARTSASRISSGGVSGMAISPAQSALATVTTRWWGLFCWKEKNMNLEDLLAWLRERMEDGEYATAETFLTDMAKRGADADEYRSSAEARMSEYAANEEAMKADIQSLKARNYDLLMQIPADNSGENDGDGVVVEDVDDDGTVYHIDNLFTDDKEGSNNGN